MEGIVAKRLDARYEAGARNYNWIKLKRAYRGELSDTIDVAVVGYRRGRGMRARMGIGALLAAVYDKKVEPRCVMTVLADEITRSPIHTCALDKSGAGLALRFPRVVGFVRDDKAPEDANTVAEIKKMYAMQKKRRLRP